MCFGDALLRLCSHCADAAEKILQMMDQRNKNLIACPGSFRDPSGRVFDDGARIVRSVEHKRQMKGGLKCKGNGVSISFNRV
ncbi:MAG: hypothetical protein LBD15_03495 [Holosporales bacterium]|nr:hypothetical protein [Holosporales bacterium]